MNKQEALNEIKSKIKALFSAEPEVQVEVKLYSCETKDGTKLEVDGDVMTIESPIFRIDENGNRLPLEDGEYELTDGNKIEVMNGMVKEMSVIEEEQTDEAIVENPVETGDYKKKNEAEMSDDRITALESKVNELVDMLGLLTTASTELSSKLTELSNQPAAKAEVFEKTMSADEARIEKFKAIQNGIKNKN